MSNLVTPRPWTKAQTCPMGCCSATTPVRNASCDANSIMNIPFLPGVLSYLGLLPALLRVSRCVLGTKDRDIISLRHGTALLLRDGVGLRRSPKCWTPKSSTDIHVRAVRRPPVPQYQVQWVAVAHTPLDPHFSNLTPLMLQQERSNLLDGSPMALSCAVTSGAMSMHVYEACSPT